MKRIQYVTFVAAPIRSYQKAFRAVAGYPVNNDIGRKGGNACYQKLQVGVQGEHLHPACAILCGQVCMIEYMQKLQLDSEYSASIKETDGFQNHFLRFSGEAQYHVYDNRDPGGMQSVTGIGKTGKRIASAYIKGGLFMDGLQPQFDPDELVRVIIFQSFQQRQHFISKAVRPCGDGDTGDIRFGKRLSVNGIQVGGRSVGIGIGLKISDIAAAGLFATKELLAGCQLLPDGKGASGSEIPAAACAAENAAAGIQRPVPVGAGKACIQRYFI